ncbi:hypothetical protein BDR26DRAFT_857631 [Obelidium mucronatum]|nr:hypothetical protein BDR26DRAFT_857631 [Obelidium mucronatum]
MHHDSVPTLIDLPFELHTQIAQYMHNPKHLARYSSVNRVLRPLWYEAAVWKQLVASNPTVAQVAAPPATTSLLDHYRVFSSTLTVPSMHITWGEDRRYWNFTEVVPGVTDIPSTRPVRKSAQIAHLISVCFVDVEATLTNVNTHCLYVPKVTMCVPRPFRSLENIVISAEVLDEDGDVELLPSNTPNRVSMTLRALVFSVWNSNNLKAPNHAEVSFPWAVVSLPKLNPNEFKSVRFRLQDHSNHWKHGLVLDSFDLVKYNELPPLPREAGDSSVVGQVSRGFSSVFSTARSLFNL